MHSVHLRSILQQSRDALDMIWLRNQRERIRVVTRDWINENGTLARDCLGRRIIESVFDADSERPSDDRKIM